MRAALIVLAAAIFAPARGHAQWEIEESHTTASLRGIHNVGGGVAWASGTNGTVLRTEDGGYLWQTCSIPPGAEKLDFRGIQAFDENTAIVMSSGPGDQSRLYKTTDGCQTWKLLFTNPDKEGFWDALKLTQPKTGGSQSGVIIGDPVNGKFAIFLTSDGGDNWRRWGRKGLGWNGKPCGEREAKSLKGEALFAASNESLLLEGQTYFLFVTGGASGSRLAITNFTASDDGFPCKTNFDIQPLLLGGSESSGAFAAGAKKYDGVAPVLMVIVGGDYKNTEQSRNTAVIAKFKGQAFHPFSPDFEIIAAKTPPHGYRSAVAYEQENKTWITVGPNGTDISTDDGRNWRALTPTPQDAPDADKNWNALSLPFVVGPKGRIGKLRGNALTNTTQGAKKP